MSRQFLARVTLLTLVGGLCAATASAQNDPASRLGPQSIVNSSGPRVVEVRAEQADTEQVSVAKPAMSGPAQPVSVLQQVAAARAEVAARQLDRLAPYNQHALPGAAVYMQSQVLPPATTIRPSRTGAPVQLFQPGSSFSHVIERAEMNQQSAQLELAAEAARSGEAQGTNPSKRSQAEVEADLAANAARLELAQLRMAQLQSLSRVSYSQLYRNLGDKLQLEIHQAQLKQQALLGEQAE